MIIIDILKNYWFWLCGALAMISFISAYIGFARAFVANESKDFIDFIYYALQIFTFQGLPEGIKENVLIKTAKLSAPISVALFSFKAFYMLLSDHLLRIRLRKYKGHVVICGLGTKGMFFLNKKLSEGEKIVVIEKSHENIDILTCKELKAPVIIGDPAEDVILENSRYQFASKIYVLTGNDMSNIAISRKIREKILCNTKDKGNRTTCFCHIHNYELKTCVENEAWVTTGSNCMEIQIFNIFEMVARDIVKNIPIEPKGKSVRDVENPWVIVIGFGAIGSAIVRQLIKMKVYPDDKQLRITIIDKEAAQYEEIFRSMYYDPHDKNKLVFKDVKIDFLTKDVRNVQGIDDLIGTEDIMPNNVYVCTGDDIETNILTYKLRTNISEDIKNEIRIIACYTNSVVKTEQIVIEKPNIEIYIRNIKEEGCRSLLDLEQIDSLARLIHSNFFVDAFISDFKKSNPESYQKNKVFLEDSKGLTIYERERKIRDKYKDIVAEMIRNKPSRKPWSELSENIKNSNRLQADHLDDKLRVLSPEFSVDSTSPEDIKSAIGMDDNLELLSKLEHKRYCAERYVLRQKIKEYEYDKLDKVQKDWNHNIINLIPALIKEYQAIKDKGERQ